MTPDRTARILLVTALVLGGLAAAPAAPAQAAVVNATLVKTTWTGGPNSTWVHPSPDPSGITYNSRSGRLIISDGEVEERGTAYPKNVWQGTNLFVAGLGGALLETGSNTVAYSNEPTGVGFRPASSLPERLFVTDDDQARVFEVDRGGDGRYGTADDSQTSSSVSFLDLGPRNDAEDVAVDLEPTRNGQLLLVDGKGKRVFVYDPGPDRVFNGTGDTVVRQINVGNMGAGDPEGIAYNPFRDTMFVLDDPSNQLYEVDLAGNLLNIVKLPFTMKSGAGIALAPPSNGSSGQNAYIVDRGVDNDTNQDTFNDGRLYEIAIPGLTGGGGGTPPANTPPTVSAGPDLAVTLPAPAALDGTITDPEGAAVTAAWSRVSGPGTVTFANAAAQDTTATFSAAGTYVLRLTGGDGQLTASDDVTVTVTASSGGGGGGSAVLDVPVRAGTDDAEERTSTGAVSLTSGDLNLGQDGTAAQTVAMRFTGVTVPRGATITDAWVQFQVDEASTAGASLTVAGEAADNAAAFTTTARTISSRGKTTATVTWAPASWPTVGARAADQRTPSLRPIVQEVVARPGWASGNALVLVVTGTGTRVAESFDGGAARAPVLHVEYTTS
ncbi:PKD domain-containing protein [Geodermatophilus sp. SYSU D01036]